MARASLVGGLLLLAFLAIVAVQAAAADPPTLEDYKKAKAEAASNLTAADAKAAKMAAVEKAITMLEDLKTTVLKEGEEEAKTYDKFSCFCKDSTADKLDEISKGEDARNTLSADINSYEGKREGYDQTVQDKTTEIQGLESDIAAAEKTRKEEFELYEANSADLKAALYALENAIKFLQASKSPSLAQMREVTKTVRMAAALAEVLGLDSDATTGQIPAAFLQAADPANEVPLEVYKFHSDDIIATLEKLQTDFRAEKVKVDDAEVEARKLHDQLLQTKNDAIKTAEGEIDTAKKNKAQAIVEIASLSQQLSTVAADLLDNKEYANQLAKMCHEKAKTWDQRTQVRSDELSALTQALAVIKGAVSDKTSGATIRFAQQGVSLRVAQAVAADAGSMRAIEASVEDSEAAGAAPKVALLATARRHRAVARRLGGLAVGGGDEGKRMVEQLLMSQGQKLKSTLLTSLATQIADDPFGKVKQLIQELIDRLLQEANSEANQKGWCDKAISDARQKREYAAKEVDTLNAEMARLEALIAQLTLELGELAESIDQIKADQQAADAMRAEEKTEHEAAVLEANEGLTALNEVIDVLETFYKTAAKATVELVQFSGPQDDAPEAGFGAGEAYTGAQGASGGVIGMLEVMKSDFVRTVTETEAAEKQAVQDHLEFMTETGKSLAEKETAETNKKKQKVNAETKFDDTKSNLDTEMATITSSIKELLELKPVCMDTGMTYEERVSHRQEEIDALKQALCILGKYAEYGPDGVASAEC